MAPIEVLDSHAQGLVGAVVLDVVGVLQFGGRGWATRQATTATGAASQLAVEQVVALQPATASSKAPKCKDLEEESPVVDPSSARWIGGAHVTSYPNGGLNSVAERSRGEEISQGKSLAG